MVWSNERTGIKLECPTMRYRTACSFLDIIDTFLDIDCGNANAFACGFIRSRSAVIAWKSDKKCCRSYLKFIASKCLLCCSFEGVTIICTASKSLAEQC